MSTNLFNAGATLDTNPGLLAASKGEAGENGSINGAGYQRKVLPEAKSCGVSVLLVDDDAGILSIMERILRSAGYEVCSAADGEAGWTAFCANEFDVVITDYEMPLLSGLGLLRRLRTGQQSVPAILVSGNMPWTEPDLPQLLMSGTTLQKPFSSFALLAAVSSAAGMGAGKAAQDEAGHSSSWN